MATKTTTGRRRRRGKPRHSPEKRAELNRQRTEQATQALLDLFRTGQLPRALATVFLAGEMPSQGWSIRNQMLVLAQGKHPDARGYDQWLQAGRPVKKDEKASVFILKPILRAPSLQRLDADGQPVDETEVVGFRPIPLFSIYQTAGPNPEVHEQALERLPLRALAKRWGIEVITFPGQGGPIAGNLLWETAADGNRCPVTITLGVTAQPL